MDPKFAAIIASAFNLSFGSWVLEGVATDGVCLDDHRPEKRCVAAGKLPHQSSLQCPSARSLSRPTTYGWRWASLQCLRLPCAHSGSYGAHIMVGAMACITLGSIVVFTAHHVWLRCTGGNNNATGGGTARTTRRTSVPIGASLCDRLLFDAVPYHHVAAQSRRSDNSGRDMRLLI